MDANKPLITKRRIAAIGGGLLVLVVLALIGVTLAVGGDGSKSNGEAARVQVSTSTESPRTPSASPTKVETLTPPLTAPARTPETGIMTGTPVVTAVQDTRTEQPVYAPPTAPPAPVLPPITAAPTLEPTQVPEGFRDDWADRLFDLINQFRVENGIPALPRILSLDDAAKNYAKYVSEHDEIYNPNVHYLDMGNGPTDPTQRAAKYGYHGLWVGEVFSANPNSPEELMDQWKNSEGHRNLILSYLDTNYDPRYSGFGVGCFQGYQYFPVNQTNTLFVACMGEFGIDN